MRTYIYTKLKLEKKLTSAAPKLESPLQIKKFPYKHLILTIQFVWQLSAVVVRFGTFLHIF